MKKKFIIRKFFGIIFIFAGLQGLSEGGPIASILISIALGVYMISSKKESLIPRKKEKEDNFEIPHQSYPYNDTYTFRVAGITYENRQKIIKSIVSDWKKENFEDVYEGLSNKEIKEAYEDIYEVDIYDWFLVVLEPDPDNVYDPDAIIVNSDYGILGYVPANETSIVHEIIKKRYDLSWELIGGKHKYYDEDLNKIVTEELTYGIEITLKSK